MARQPRERSGRAWNLHRPPPVGSDLHRDPGADGHRVEAEQGSPHAGRCLHVPPAEVPRGAPLLGEPAQAGVGEQAGAVGERRARLRGVYPGAHLSHRGAELGSGSRDLRHQLLGEHPRRSERQRGAREVERHPHEQGGHLAPPGLREASQERQDLLRDLLRVPARSEPLDARGHPELGGQHRQARPGERGPRAVHGEEPVGQAGGLRAGPQRLERPIPRSPAHRRITRDPGEQVEVSGVLRASDPQPCVRITDRQRHHLGCRALPHRPLEEPPSNTGIGLVAVAVDQRGRPLEVFPERCQRPLHERAVHRRYDAAAPPPSSDNPSAAAVRSPSRSAGVASSSHRPGSPRRVTAASNPASPVTTLGRSPRGAAESSGGKPSTTTASPGRRHHLRPSQTTGRADAAAASRSRTSIPPAYPGLACRPEAR